MLSAMSLRAPGMKSPSNVISYFSEIQASCFTRNRDRASGGEFVDVAECGFIVSLNDEVMFWIARTPYLQHEQLWRVL